MKADKPSDTALLIAKSIVFMAGDSRYRALMAPDMESLTYEFLKGATSRITAALFRHLGKLWFVRRAALRIEAASVPGMIGHYIVRKRRIEELVTEFSSKFDGLDQLVILGAGLDTLGTRVSRSHGKTRVFEIDHPATSQAKQRAFSRAYISQPVNLTLQPTDLADNTLVNVLRTLPGFSFDASTVFIAEGVFMYLKLESVGGTLDVLHSFPKTRAAFIFTYMLPSPLDGRPAFVGQTPSVDQWLGRKSEPFVWGKTPEDLDRFVKSRLLIPLGHADGLALRSNYLTTQTLSTVSTAVGENIAWIEA